MFCFRAAETLLIGDIWCLGKVTSMSRLSRLFPSKPVDQDMDSQTAKSGVIPVTSSTVSPLVSIAAKAPDTVGGTNSSTSAAGGSFSMGEHLNMSMYHGVVWLAVILFLVVAGMIIYGFRKKLLLWCATLAALACCVWCWESQWFACLGRAWDSLMSHWPWGGAPPQDPEVPLQVVSPPVPSRDSDAEDRYVPGPSSPTGDRAAGSMGEGAEETYMDVADSSTHEGSESEGEGSQSAEPEGLVSAGAGGPRAGRLVEPQNPGGGNLSVVSLLALSAMNLAAPVSNNRL